MEGAAEDSKGGGHAPQNVPGNAFAAVSAESGDIEKGKYGLDISMVQKTRSGQLKLPRQGAFCHDCPEDSGGGDIVEVQPSRLTLF